MAPLLCMYRHPGGNHEKAISIISSILGKAAVEVELCFYIAIQEELTDEEKEKLKWVLTVPFEDGLLTIQSVLKPTKNDLLIEIGPRLNFSTPFSTNCVSICHSIGLRQITRVESSTRYLVCLDSDVSVTKDLEENLVHALHDRMTECRYTTPLTTFEQNVKTEEVYEVDVVGCGKAALEEANKELGLAFDDWDLDLYCKMFEEEKRNPTSVELFDLAQSNSEHSRHWFFKGRMVVDGSELPDSLFTSIMSTQQHTNDNSVIKFSDNSSAIKGHTTKSLVPADSYGPGPLLVKDRLTRHIVFTAETHNFPTGVAPFPGATTGTGGRIRDVQSTGRGAHVVAGTAGYSFGNLLIPDYALPWEQEGEVYPSNFASPAEIAIEASNGASDYGNKFGEPVLTGFARSFGLRLPGGERREYVKPIMFSGGIGTLDSDLVNKLKPDIDMEVVKVGGPVYRIGVGGGAASSVQVQGDNKEELDFGAVQRGDAEMEQKMNRVVRACIEQGANNPICSIHDQGAGGNGNVLKELVDPAGAVIRADDFQLGDPTLSIMELWGAEYQESNALLVHERHIDCLRKVGQRERCPVSFVGCITGTGKIQLQDFQKSVKKDRLPVDLDLKQVLGSMPRKVFQLSRRRAELLSLSLPAGLRVPEALSRVLRLPAVASKRYLTNKVDRSVTGLVAQQQCVGPLHTPLADVAVIATSYFDTVGAATAIGEQPVKGLLDPACGARMSVAESITNLAFAYITDLRDVKCSGNWMWAAKMPGEGAALVDACMAMCDVMKRLGIAVDGGKDSLSMAARTGSEVVKAPGTLVISTYAPCLDITATVTPDLKCPDGEGRLLWVSLGAGKNRLGGSALAQCYKQVGDESPDLDQPELLVNAFSVVQKLIAARKLTAGHDVSDGGVVTSLLEMAFAGNCGLEVNIITSPPQASGDDGSVICDTDAVLSLLFAEEVGLVLETRRQDALSVITEFISSGVSCLDIGSSVVAPTPNECKVKISIDCELVLEEKMVVLRDWWEETSFVLERRQASLHCVQQEQHGLRYRTAPQYTLPFDPNTTHVPRESLGGPPRVAVIREEGSNGDREMAAAFSMAGFEPWDINMQDLMDGAVTLAAFRGVAFVGGFSYADVCGSAKGWAATARFNAVVKSELERFKQRQDTFSLGVCNGCQLMALLGWVAPYESGQGLLLAHNDSQRFESRFSTVRVGASPSVMMKGMEGTTFGIWVSHGEGKFVFKTPSLLEYCEKNSLVTLQYVDDNGEATEGYPHNPNGSPHGLAGLCSQDGRHLAVMPHPERCVLPWQCPWMPTDMRERLKFSPWIRMFQNAYDWCLSVYA